MTTPSGPSYSGLPSDKLIPPLNAPKAGAVSPGVQPGVSTGIVLAQYVIVFGTTGGVFIYAGTPALGNPPVYWLGNVTADPYGNPLNQGIWAGQTGSNQIGLQTQPNGNFAAMFFVIPGAFQGDALILAVGGGGQSVLEISSAVNLAPKSDHSALFMYDNVSGGGSALWQLNYFDTNGSQHQHGVGSFAGVTLDVTNVTAADPAHGTSLSDVAVNETWHNITVDAGWTVVVQPQYRLLPDGNVQVIGLITHAGTAAQTNINNSNPIPAVYSPSTTRYYRTPMPSPDLAGSVQIQPNGVFVMRASGFTATQAIMDGIYAR